MTASLQTALDYIGAKISVIPVRADGTKRPALSSWSEYQRRLPTKDETQQWFRNGSGIAAIGGKVSGDLEILDFEDTAPFDEWLSLIREHLGTSFCDSLVITETPSGGRHVFTRCHGGVQGNQKLALRRGSDHSVETVIETRGEGGYVLLPGSPVQCHSLSRPYTLLQGDFDHIPEISSKQRDILLSCARSFNEIVQPDQKRSAPKSRQEGMLSPGDDFNARAQWPDVLKAHGYKSAGYRRETGLWTRPGKQDGISATTNYDGSDLFYPFSTNCYPFDNDRGYSKFAVYAFLNHNGDFSAAARQLGREGYGSRQMPTVPYTTSCLTESEPATELPPEKPGLSDMALHGLAGDVIRAIDPHTEASNAALLVQLLVRFGNQIGRVPYFRAEAVRHYSNEFAVIVGATAKGRKGSSDSQISRIFDPIDPEFRARNRQHGLSSGEGLIWAIRDAIEETLPIKDKGKFTGQYETIVKDRGIEDKRAYIIEAEFGSTLRVMSRDGNSLSAIIRCAWDGDTLKSLTKNSPARATDPHISIIGHCTAQELLRNLDSTEAGNGFGNRFLWVYAERSKLLPDGGAFETVDSSQITQRLQQAIEFARKAGEIRRDDPARELWHAVYGELSEGKVGLLGAMTARAEAHVMRLAMLYALLDQSTVIKRPHLEAGLAFWDYCEESARYIFGDCLGDPIADEILRALRNTPAGLTKTEIGNLFGRNKTSAQITRALTELLTSGLARFESEETEGRHAERWFAKGRKHG